MFTIAPSEPMTSLANPGWIPWPLYRLTLDQYEAMVASGVFSGRERFHLINGFLVAKMTQNDLHATADELCGDALGRTIPAGWHVPRPNRSESRARPASRVLLADHGNDNLFGPRGACGGGVFRSRFTCRVFGRASILASPSLERRRMTKMPPDGYPALQYLQSVRVSSFLFHCYSRLLMRRSGACPL